MKLSEAIYHLQQLKRWLGDVELLVDTDIWKDTMPRGVTSLSAVELLKPPVSFVEGVFTHDNKSTVVMYVGNEPKTTIM